MEDHSNQDCSLSLSALRLLVSPIRLLSAAVWKTVQQNAVVHYEMLQEFVSMVTDVIPELLTPPQRAQLILGLRARFILELCQCETSADSEIVQHHLDRMQSLMEEWDDASVSNYNFVDLVKNLLEDPEKKEHFFQTVFLEQFGPTFDEALRALTWLFLSRLEKFFPLQTFEQVASLFGEVSSVLEDAMASVTQCEEFSIALQYQKDLKHLDHDDSSLDDTCIISALKLSSLETRRNQAHDHALDYILSDMTEDPSSLPHQRQKNSGTVIDHHASELETDKTNQTHDKNETGVFRDVPGHKENGSLLQSETQDVVKLEKQCVVKLERVDVPLSSLIRSMRQNRGRKMKEILLQEKKGLCEKPSASCEPASRKVKPLKRAQGVSDSKDLSVFSKETAPISDCSDNDSWSYYSDNGSFCTTDSSSCSMDESWSNLSEDVSATVSSAGLLSSYSNEDPPFVGILRQPSSAYSRESDVSNNKATPEKKIRKVYCFICEEHVTISLRLHMKTHFPTGGYACPRCDSRFQLLSSLQLHMRRTCFELGNQLVDPEKPEEKSRYKCDKCQAAYRYKISLDRHKLTHDALYCSVCRKVLRDAATLARHKASHTAFQCTRCEETFTLFLPLLRHFQNIHRVRHPFTCNHCPKAFPKLRLLILHEWKHTGRLPFQCARCGCRFRSDADLCYHERVHTREKPFLCSECGKTFAQNSNLLRHFRLVHSQFKNGNRYHCNQCDKSFKEKGGLKKHKRSKHLNELFRHQCPDCGKMVCLSAFPRHKLIHTGEKPFKCTVPECDKHFRSTAEMKRHALRQHTTERPFTCNVCGKGFIKKSILNIHAKIHSGEKPFVCHICGKAFLKRYSMQRHKKLIHTSITL